MDEEGRLRNRRARDGELIQHKLPKYTSLPESQQFFIKKVDALNRGLESNVRLAQDK